MSRYISRFTLATLPAFALACTSQPVILPSRDFNRPTDITFVCMGAFDTTASSVAADGGAATGSDAAAVGGRVVSGRPMRWCHPRTSFDPAPGDQYHTYAFLPNSSSGELSVIDANTWQLVDLDLANAGFNGSPLGVLPTQIVASDDGCRLVTANQGSCDLSLVDPSLLLTPTLSRTIAGLPIVEPSASTATVTPYAADGTKLRVAPGEVAFLPRDTSTMTGADNLCQADWSWQAVVTFPSCGLVALLDLPSGRIIDSVYVRSENGTVSTVPAGANPICAMRDCRDDGTKVDVAPVADSGVDAADAGDDVGDASSEAGADASGVDGTAGTDAGADATSGGTDATSSDAAEAGPTAAAASTPTLLHPNPIAINPVATGPGTFRTFVGLADSPAILRFDVSTTRLAPDSQGAVLLTPDALGTNRLRLSIDPYSDQATGASGSLIAGNFVGDTSSPAVQDRKYLYAITRDGTVRVVWVATTTETECDTNVDPLHIPAGHALTDACIPASDVLPSQRRPTALGPGLRLPTPAIDIAAADIRPERMPDQSETSVTGAHTWIMTASGAVYLANLDPVPRLIPYVEPDGTVKACATPVLSQCEPEIPPTQIPQTLPPNLLRNANFFGYDLSLDPSAGLPRVDVLPTASTIGPRVELLWTRGTANNATALSGAYLQTPVFFPDPLAVHAQTWSIVWEGNLLGSPRFTGQVIPSGAGNVALADPGGNFCSLGLQANDLVTIHGCIDDTECGIGKVCVLGTDGSLGAGSLPINGLCLSPTTPEKTCDALLSTVRRYDVATARPTTLDLVPHKDELVRPNLQPCILTGGSAGAGGDAGAAADAAPGSDVDGGSGDGAGDGGVKSLAKSDCENPEDPATIGFQCIDGRCLQPCTTAGTSEGCRAGRLCVPFGLKATPTTPKAPAKPDECDTHDCFCADGPNLATSDLSDCLGELFAYNVGVGRGFLVVGSQTGVQATGVSVPDPNDITQSICAPDPNLDPRTVMRISMDAPTCTNLGVDPTMLDSRCDPDLTTTVCPDNAESAAEAQQLVELAKTPAASNPCLFVGGPNDGDPSGGVSSDGGPSDVLTKHIHALFRNDEVQFMMTNLEQSPSGAYQIRFDVHGGFKAQTVTIPADVQLTMPARLVLGPVDSIVPQSGLYDSEVPYLFVVDQRRLGTGQGGGPTRGQLLRINPRGELITTPVAGAQPWFEDLTNSGNLFPIQ